MSLFWLVILVLIVYLIYRLIKKDRDIVPKAISGESAMDILAERYAKGELTKEQYMQMKDDLNKV